MSDNDEKWKTAFVGVIRMGRLGKIFFIVWLISISNWVSGSSAEPAPKIDNNLHAMPQEAMPPKVLAAHEVVQTMTDDLLLLIEAAQRYSAENNQQFFVQLDDLLRPVVDFKSFSRAVMGKHASSKKMTSLSIQEQQRLKSQMKRFSGIFSLSLIQTYGKGLLAFEGQKIEVVVPAKINPLATKARVKQLIYGDRQQPYEIQYSLRKNTDGQWKLRNMVVESINLGMIYRNQFDSAVQIYEGDIDKVIDNWSASDGDAVEDAEKSVGK